MEGTFFIIAACKLRKEAGWKTGAYKECKLCSITGAGRLCRREEGLEAAKV